MENLREKKLIKISFIGDIMCEKPLLKASYVGNGKYNFDEVFERVVPFFKQSDYVVGNLETICAGEQFKYTDHIFSFNSPLELIESIKKSGIHMVTTATNHSLDRGIEGLKENLRNLRRAGIDSIGTYLTEKERNSIFMKSFNGMKIAFLNYTYGTNTHINGEILDEDELFHIGLLKPQDDEVKRYFDKKHPTTFKGKIAKSLFNFITLEQWIKVKKILNRDYYTAYQDNDLSYIDESYLNVIKDEISEARENADYVIVCMHSGGQFHPEPGEFSRCIMNFMSENGVDLVVGNHPHVVQKSFFDRKMFGAYSLGNFSISPSSVYVLHDNLPEYSIMLHVYLNTDLKEVDRLSFSILKIQEDKNGSLIVNPIKKLYEKCKLKEEQEEIEKNVTKIYNTFTNKCVKSIKIQDEYSIERDK